MKKLLNIIILLAIVLNIFGQSKIKKDIVEAEEQLIIQDVDFVDWLDDSTGAVLINGSNGLSKNGNDIEWGNSTLDTTTTIAGGGNILNLGTAASKLSILNSNVSGNISIVSDALIGLGAEGKSWIISGDYIINFSNSDTLCTLTVLEAAIEAAQPVLPFNYDYTFSSSITDARPGIGYFKFNNATLANVTEIYIDYYDANSVAKNDWLSLSDTGSYITVQTDDNNYAIYQLTDALIDATNYFKYNVTYSSHSGVISGLNTIDVELNNTTGSGGGGTATSEHAYFDTISSHNNSFVYFDSTVVIEDSLIVNTSLKMYKDGFGQSVIDGTDGYIYITSELDIGLVTEGDNANISLSTEGLNSDIILDSGSDDIRIEAQDRIDLQAESEVIKIDSYISTVEIESGTAQSSYIFDDDTLFMDGTNGSTENVIKVTGAVIGGGEVVDTTYSSDYVMENTLIDKLQFNPTSQAYSEGTLFADSSERSLSYYNEFVDFKEEIGRGTNVVFYNNTGSTIPDGTLIRSIGAKVNGSITFEADLSGNGSLDSLQGIAMTTVSTINEAYGIATLIGQVNGLNTSAYSDNDVLYVGHEGGYTNVNPEPPLYSSIFGRCQYADDDSGSVYMFPTGDAQYRPNPTFTASFEDSTETITNPGIDTYELITSATSTLFDEKRNVGFTFQGDSISPMQDGNYTVFLSYSFQGTVAQTDKYRIATFIDGVKGYSTSRTASGANNGGVPYPYSSYLTAGQWISFRIANVTDGTRDCVFTDGTVTINYSE